MGERVGMYMPNACISFRSHTLHGVCTLLRCQNNREDEGWAKEKEREELWAIKQVR